MWSDSISLSLSCVSTEIHKWKRDLVPWADVLEDSVGSFSKGFFCTLHQTWHRLALLTWRTHKLTCLLFLTLGSKMQPEYAKSTSSHACFASVPSNNLHLSSYMTSLGGKLSQFESLRQRRKLDPECLFPGWMFECLWQLHFPSAATGKKAATTFLWGCVSLCQTLQKPGREVPFFSHLHQV